MFNQVLAPFADSLVLSALLAALPLVTLFALLGIFKVKAAYAALASLAVAVLLAIAVWGMPVGQAFSATAEGAFYGLFPILWILVAALWVYNLTVATGWFDALGRIIRSISDDPRVLAILIAFCFGALLEALAGFGAPVAISAAMLMAAGMKPVRSAVVSLVANTAPVAFGAMAAPITALAGVTGLPVHDVSAMTGRQTPFVALFVPLLLVLIVDGKRGVRQTWPVALVAGAVFGATQFVVSNFLAFELTDVIASLLTVGAVLLMLKFWQPRGYVASADTEQEGGVALGRGSALDAPRGPLTGGGVAAPVAELVELETDTRTEHEYVRRDPARVLKATAPYIAIIVIFSLAQIPAVKSWLAVHGTVGFTWPGLHVLDANGKAAGNQVFHLDHLKATGTLLFLSGLATMAIYKIKPAAGALAFGRTVKQLRWTIVTVASVLALAFVMNLSGQTSTLGYALASTGALFVVLSPAIGWLGVALTGSDTSSNSLFGLLQVTAAQQAGLQPVLVAAANSAAGVMGKMLSVQNLAVAAAAVGLKDGEHILLRKVVWWSLGLLAFVTVLVVLQSTPVLGWMVP